MYQKLPNAFLTGAEATCIKRLSDNAFIPFDPQNRDYAEYLAWVEAGNTPLPAEEQTGQNPV